MPLDIRPACNLDTAGIAALEALSQVHSKTIWRVTFQGDEGNPRTYDLHLPDIAKAPDVQRIISVLLIAVPVFLLALAALTVFLIIRRKRKKRKALQ